MEVDADSIITAFKILQAQSITEVDVSFTEDGLKLFAVDPAHISAASVAVLPAAFTDYEQLDKFNIPISFILDALKPGTRPSISIDNGTLIVKSSRSKRTHRVSVPTEVLGRMPQFETTATCMTTSDALKDLFSQTFIKDMSGVGDDIGILFRIEDDKLYVSGKNNTETFEEELDCTSLGTGSTRILPEYIIKIAKALPKDTSITFSFADNYPIQFMIETELINATIMIAPLISTEE